MLVSANNLKSIISTKLGASPGGLDLCQLAHANTEVSTGYRYACYEAFPSAACNIGKFAYANNENIYYISDGTSWSTNFSSAKQAGGSLTGKLWGCMATCGPNFSSLVSGNTPVPTCPFSPADVDFNPSDILTSDTFVVSLNNFFYVKNGKAYGWGCNGSGELGIGSSSFTATPRELSGSITNWKKISSVTNHTLGLTTSGCVYSWGANNYGQLGDCTTIGKTAPINPCLTGSNWCDIFATGKCSSFALNSSGIAFGWGKNYYGQLGVNDATDCCCPRQVLGSGWCKISGSTYHTLGLKTDGTVWGWGYNASGELGTGSTTSTVSPIQVSGGGTNWIDVAAGGNGSGLSAGVKSDGSLWTWGVGGPSILDSTGRSSPFSPLIAGPGWSEVYAEPFSNTVFGKKSDGTLWAWGNYNCYAHGFTAQASYFTCCGPIIIGSPNEAWLRFSFNRFNFVGIATKVTGY